MMPAAIPPELLTIFEPAALFAVWTGVVVVVLLGLCALLTMDGGATGRRPGQPASDDEPAAA
jgi:hypothetical protein